MKILDWIKINNMKFDEFCKLIDFSRSYSNLIVNGRRFPSFKFARAVERATNGEIKEEEVMCGMAIGKRELTNEQIKAPSIEKIKEKVKESKSNKLSLL